MMIFGDREAAVMNGTGRGYMHYCCGKAVSVHVYKADGRTDWRTYPALVPLDGVPDSMELFHTGGRASLSFVCADELTAEQLAFYAPGSSCYAVPYADVWKTAWTEQLVKDGVKTVLCVMPFQCPDACGVIDLSGLPDGAEERLVEIRKRTQEALHGTRSPDSDMI